MEPDQHQADTAYLVRKSSNAGYRILSIITPPVYAAYVISRRGRGAFSINGLLRSAWVGGVAGAVGGAGVGLARYSYTNHESVRAKRIQTAYDTNRIRAEDHSTIGGILFSVITPALLWKRAKIYNLILGGAGLGSAVGSLFHYTKTITGDVPAKAYIPDSVHTA